MKKIYTLLAMAFTLSGTIMAQQLPVADEEIITNDIGSFDGLWEDCYPNGGNTKVGNQPPMWSASNIKQSFVEKELVTQNNKDRVQTQANTYSVDLTNIYCGLSGLGSTAPAYITLGEAWSYGSSNIEDSDGGSYGGINFTYRPDAISLWIKRLHGTKATEGKLNSTEKATVLLYSWKGETSSKMKIGLDMPLFGDVKEITMLNRDRDVLGMITDGVTKSEDFELVSKLEEYIDGDFADWTNFVYDINYETTTAVPEMLNIVISAANYFDARENIGEGNFLNVDDVSFIYYSTLSKLSIAGRNINLVDDTYEYNLVGVMPTSAEEVVATTKGKFAETKVDLNADEKKVTITVTNQGGEDIDGKTEHVYTISYSDPISTETHEGYLNISMAGSPLAQNQAATIQIDVVNEGVCTFILPNFSLGGSMSFGNIVVENVTMTEDNGIKTYKGTVKGLELQSIVADVDINGTIDVENNIDFDINVTWNNMPINVTFSSQKTIVSTEKHNGFLNIAMGEEILVANEAKEVEIANYGDNSCKFTLPDFSILSMDLHLGDIVVDNMALATENGTETYAGEVKNMQLMNGEIIADVAINGTITSDDLVDFKIDVIWHYGETDIPIAVTFTTNKVYEVKEYSGYLNVEMEGILIVDNQEDAIEILQTGDNSCTFTLSDLQITMAGATLPLGDIVVENVSMTIENGNTVYEGSVSGMKLMGGNITANVDINGTISADGKIDFKIDVLWVDNNLPITVTFTSDKVEHVSVNNINDNIGTIYGNTGSIAINGYTGTVNVYSITGQFLRSETINENANIEMETGIYIVRIADTISKVVVK